MSVIQRIRALVANRQARTNLMWVFVTIGVMVLAFGLYLVITNHLEYMDKKDETEKSKKNEEAYLAQFMVEQDGQMMLDYQLLSSADQMVLVKFRTDQRKLKNEEIDAYNDRSQGIRIAGFGVIGLALGYLVSPERKKDSAEGTVPPASEQPPFDLSQ